MKTLQRSLIALLTLIVFTCRKPEKPWKLPEQPIGRIIEAKLGVEYDTVVFISLEQGKTHSVLRREWDLAVRPYAGNYAIELNAAMYAFAAELSQEEWQNLQEARRDLPWRCDLADTLALAPLQSGETRYLLLDRDRSEVFYKQPQQRFYKIALARSDREITIFATSIRGGDTLRWRFPLSTDPLYLSLNKPSGITSILPPWHSEIILTRYIHPFYDQPEEFRWYPVLGALCGEGVEVAVVRSNQVPYDQMDYNKARSLTYTSKRNAIGYEWKRYDFGTGTYQIDFSRYFVIRRGTLTYYKFRFLDFYDNQGRKGTVKLEYEPL
ncbi:MAG: HmuY family protein [Bacteroidia bacterium]|nr:HmuY family protein [Bacteroidia bacterium]MDW8235551.1 HmuY family protein [Bacteroidia bacterium]